MAHDNGGPMHPIEIDDPNWESDVKALPDRCIIPGPQKVVIQGASLWDHYYGMAMQAIISKHPPVDTEPNASVAQIQHDNIQNIVKSRANGAALYADAMIAEKRRREDPK